MPAKPQRDGLLALKTVEDDSWLWEVLLGENFCGLTFLGRLSHLTPLSAPLRGPPRPRPAPATGEAENKENHHEASAMGQQPLRRGYRRPYNYRRRPRPASAPAQEGKEVRSPLLGGKDAGIGMVQPGQEKALG